jgi:hypothetical protein
MRRSHLTVRKRGDMAAQNPLRFTLVGRRLSRDLQILNLSKLEKREVFQIGDDIFASGVDPELVHVVGRGLVGIEPHGVAFGLSELRAVNLRYQ